MDNTNPVAISRMTNDPEFQVAYLNLWLSMSSVFNTPYDMIRCREAIADKLSQFNAKEVYQARDGNRCIQFDTEDDYLLFMLTYG